jgi:exosortase
MESLRVTMNRNTIAAAALVAIGLLILYADVLTKLLSAWRTDDNYSHGFFIVPIAVYLAWERRGQLAAATRRPSALGLLVVLASTVVLAAGVLGSELFLTRVSLIGVLGGIVLFMFGWQHLRILAFPLLFLLLMIPLPAIIFNKIAFPLQLLASRTGEYALSSVDIPVLREGNVLILANTSLEVAEACSGIRSLVSLVALSLIIARTTEHRTWARALIVLSAAPVAVLVNALRVTTTAAATYWYGRGAAEGLVHELVGLAMFIVALALVMSCGRGIARLGPEPNRLEMAG